MAGDGLQLLGNPIAAAEFAQEVDAGQLHFRVVAHHGAGHGRLRREAILVQHVAGEDHPVRAAPLVDGAGEVFQEQFFHQLHILPLDLGGHLVLFEEQRGQVGQQVVAVFFLEALRQRRRPGDLPFASVHALAEGGHQRAAVRFIGENAQDAIANARAAFLHIALVGHLQEGFRGFPVHGVHIGGAVIETAAGHFHHSEPQRRFARLGRFVRRERAIGNPTLPVHAHGKAGEGRPLRRVRVFTQAQKAHPVGGILRHRAARRAAGPAVFIV